MFAVLRVPPRARFEMAEAWGVRFARRSRWS